MTTIAEIFRRVRERLSQNQGMPGNNCLIYFDNLAVHGDIYDGNVSAAQIGNARGPWKAVVHLRLKLEFTDPDLNRTLDGLERVITEWANDRNRNESEEP